jgi:predicted short-subunit dehydrogenase-like oxidoreductase (DUF2520 family)
VSSKRARIVGPGRAGLSFERALESVGWRVVEILGRHDDVSTAAEGVDLVLITTPDSAIAAVAGSIAPAEAVVAHAAGSLGLAELAPHRRRAAIHPLISLPNAEVGAARLVDAGWFAVAGDPLVGSIVEDLGGSSFTVADEDRTLYHAAACVASNHLVALLGQVERLSSMIGVPMEAYLALTKGSVEAVAELGAASALTGPAARGDNDTIARHLEALPARELDLYRALVGEARLLAGRPDQGPQV